LEAENTTLTAANMTLTAQVQNLSGGAVAGGAARGGAGAAPLVTFAETPAMVNHQDLINFSMKVGTTIYNEGCKKLTTEFNIKSSGTVVFSNRASSQMRQDGVAHGHPANHLLYQHRWLYHQHHPPVNTAAFQTQYKVFVRALELCSKQEQGRTT
jgi:hypothetical protein